MTPSVAAIRSIMSRASDGVVVTLSDIILPSAMGNLHFCNNTVDVIYEGITYKAANFAFDPPDNKPNDVGVAQISLCVVDQVLPAIVESITEAPIFRMHTILNMLNGTAERLAVWDFELRNVSWTNLTMSADLQYETFLEQQLPSQVIDAYSFPGSF